MSRQRLVKCLPQDSEDFRKILAATFRSCEGRPDDLHKTVPHTERPIAIRSVRDRLQESSLDGTQPLQPRLDYWNKLTSVITLKNALDRLLYWRQYSMRPD